MSDLEIVIAALREVALNLGCNSDDLSDRLARTLENLADTIAEGCGTNGGTDGPG